VQVFRILVAGKAAECFVTSSHKDEAGVVGGCNPRSLALN